jgi:hypothetical protein
VDARDHPVELLEEVVVVVERSVGEDVYLTPREQLDPLDLGSPYRRSVLAEAIG